MKSRKKLRKTSNRKKNKINRKKSRKIYKKVKYGGQDPPILADKDKELEFNQRNKIGSIIYKLREKLKNNENDEALKNDIFNLISFVYVYKNMSAPNLTFSKFEELYRERNYYYYERSDLKYKFFEKYNDLNKLLDIIESDFNRAADDYKKHI